MKTKDDLRQETPGSKLIKGWLFTLNLFFIVFSLFMLGKFLLGPQSGRISTLVCQPDPWGKLVCTVKIYGVHKLFRLDFYADDYMGTYLSTNFELGEYARPSLNDLSLPWDDSMGAGSSGEYACALSIRIQSQLVDFVPPYQNGSVCSRAQAAVEAAFAGDRSAINLRFDGINPNLYWRIALIGIASFLFVVQCGLRFRRMKLEKNLTIQVEQQEDLSATGKPDIQNTSDLPPARDSQSAPPDRRRFILSWWAASAVVALFLILSLLLISIVGRHLPSLGCYLSIADYRKLLVIFPVRNLISLSPMVILSTLLAALQWYILRAEIKVSRLWMAAPILAGIPILLGIPPALTCDQASAIEFPLLGSLLGSYEHSYLVTNILLVGYFLILGFIQWLVLRRQARYSIGWIAFPFLSAFVEVFMLTFMFLLSLTEILVLIPVSMTLPAIICLAIIIFILATSINLVPGIYLHWAIQKKQSKPIMRTSG